MIPKRPLPERDRSVQIVGESRELPSRQERSVDYSWEVGIATGRGPSPARQFHGLGKSGEGPATCRRRRLTDFGGTLTGQHRSTKDARKSVYESLRLVTLERALPRRSSFDRGSGNVGAWPPAPAMEGTGGRSS